MARFLTLLGLFFMGGAILWIALKIAPQAAAPVIFILGTLIYLAGKIKKKNGPLH